MIPRWGAALLAWACASAPDAPAGLSEAQSARRYAELLTAENPRQALPGCAELPQPDVRGDCALSLVLQIRATERVDLGPLCPSVPEGAWRDECWFLHAEDAAERKRYPEAAQACEKAHSFKHDCGQHLWQSKLRRVVHMPRDQPLADRLRRARRLYARWEPHLGWSDIDWRFWHYFFETVLEQSPGIDLRTCDALAEDLELRLRCRYAGGHLYLRRVWDHLHHQSERERFCAAPDLDVAATEALLARAQARPDPLLEAVVAEQRAAVCGADAPGPVEDGVVSRKALDAAIAAARIEPSAEGAGAVPADGASPPE